MPVRNGKSKVLIVHDRNVAGEVGKSAIERGVASAGGSVVGVTSYEFSQNGIMQAASGSSAPRAPRGRRRCS